jgi:hypothetical protein
MEEKGLTNDPRYQQLLSMANMQKHMSQEQQRATPEPSQVGAHTSGVQPPTPGSDDSLSQPPMAMQGILCEKNFQNFV